MAAEGTGFLVLIVLEFRADYQLSTKSSNSLQVEDIILCKIFKTKGFVPKVILEKISRSFV